MAPWAVPLRLAKWQGQALRGHGLQGTLLTRETWLMGQHC